MSSYRGTAMDDAVSTLVAIAVSGAPNQSKSLLSLTRSSGGGSGSSMSGVEPAAVESSPHDVVGAAVASAFEIIVCEDSVLNKKYGAAVNVRARTALHCIFVSLSTRSG